MSDKADKRRTLCETIIGGTLACFLIGVLWVWAKIFPHPPEERDPQDNKSLANPRVAE